MPRTGAALLAAAVLLRPDGVPAQEPPPAVPLPRAADGSVAMEPEGNKPGAELPSTDPTSGPPAATTDSKSNAGTTGSPESDGKTGPCEQDPVQVVSGAMVLGETDLVVTCPHLDLVLMRAYDSNLLTTGAFGPRWTHSYDWQIVRYKPTGGEFGDWLCLRAKADPWQGPYGGAFHWFKRLADGRYSVSGEAPYVLAVAPDGTYSVRLPGGVAYRFGSDGVLDRIDHPAGAAVQLTYADRGSADARRLVRVEHSNGQFLAFSHRPDGRVSGVATADPAVSVAYEYTVGEKPAVAATTRHTPRGDIVLRYRYDRWSASAGGGSTPGVIPPYRLFGTESWSEADQSLHVVASVPPSMRRDFDPPPLAVSPGARESVGGRMVERTDANGVSAWYTYRQSSDATGSRVRHTAMAGGLFSGDLEYRPGRTVLSARRGDRTLATAYEYDARNRVVAVLQAEPDGRNASFVWNATRDVVRSTETDKATGRFLRTDADYGPYHNPTRVGSALDAAPQDWWQIAWNPDWLLPDTLTTPEGRVFRAEHGPQGLPTRFRADGPGGAPLMDTRVAYGPGGLPAAVTNANGRSAAFEYTAAGYLSAVVPEAGPRVELRRTSLGFVDRVTLPGPDGPRATEIQVDERGRPLHVAHPDGTTETLAYNGTGRPVLHVDAAGRTNRTEWLLGTPVLSERLHAESGQFARTAVAHDLEMNTVAIADALGRPVESYVLDAADRIVLVTNLEGQALSAAYAVGGLPASVARFDGSTVAYAYDQAGNLARVAYGPSDAVAFGYDRDGLLLAASNALGTVSNRHNEAGWLVATAFHPADPAHPVQESSFSYYPAGQVSNTVSSAGTATYLLGPSDRLDALIQSPIGNQQSAIAFSYSYCDWNSLVSAVTNSAGLSVAYAYDLMDRPTNIVWRAADGTLLRSFGMAYNALGMVTNVTHADAYRRAYAFDSLDRLVGERQLAPDGTPLREAVYAYDLVGNRTQTVIDGATETYALGVGNRLATFGANAYTHDAAGCVTRIARAGQPALDLTWDAQYRLTAVSTNGVVVEAYGYDPLGRRAYTATATSSGTVTNWHAYVGMHCAADLDADGNVLRSYTWGPGIDNLLAMTVHGATETNTYFALTDHLGTVHALVSSVGSVLSVVESCRYDAWGNVLAVYDAQGSLLPASSLGNRFLFQCREYSWATRLTNFRARWYDPSTGRWLSNDPIGISGGLNQYVFCGNDPVDCVDPWGLEVAAIFDRSMGELWVRDEQTGRKYTAKDVFSGNGQHRNNPASEAVPDEGPIPAGKYRIGPAYQKNGQTWYRLLRENADGSIEDGCYVTDANGNSVRRSGFNLHVGSVSLGCVTVPSQVPPDNPDYPSSTHYDEIRKILDNTSTIKVGRNRYVGTLTVY